MLFRLLSASALLAVIPAGSAAGAEESTSIRSRANAAADRGIQFLLTNQDRDGSWGSSRWTGGVDGDPVPGAFHSFDVAVTAMCLEALLPYRDREGVPAVLAKAEAFLWQEFPRIRRPHPRHLPHVWSYCYGIQVLAELHRGRADDPEARSRIEKQIRTLIAGLELFEAPQGGWFYYANSTTRRPLSPSASFVNAAVLTALHRARGIGVEPPAELVKKALWATRQQRKPDSSYLYSFNSPLTRAGAMREINRPAGSLGRSQACNHALRLWEDPAITPQVIDTWLERLVTRQGWLDMGRKRPIPHESHAAVAGYFYYFGHYYAGLCLAQSSPALRAGHQEALAEIITTRQEADGSWFDYPLYSYHKPYGTAFALMTLTECLREP